LGWRYDNGKLLQLRLMESITEPDGQFGEKIVPQVRVLEPGKWCTYRKNEKNEWVVHLDGTTTIDFVPFVFLYGIRKAYGIGAPPLLDLAYQNVEHWQSCSDQQSILHVARVPILFAKGFGDSSITIGAGVAASSDNEHAELSWVEHSGAAISAGKESILALEDRMQQAGAEMLIKRAGQTTATQVLSENEANKSLLQNIVEEFEDGVSMCLEYAAKWVGETYTPDVDLYKDFAMQANDTDIDYLLRAHEAQIIDAKRVTEEMTRRGILAPEQTSQGGE
jgi:hypothetical protein